MDLMTFILIKQPHNDCYKTHNCKNWNSYQKSNYKLFNYFFLRRVFFMNLSEKFCGICGSEKYCPLISQIIGEFIYEFICGIRGICGSKKYCPLISQIIGEFFFEFICGICGSKRYCPLILQIIGEFFFMNLSENICGICGSKRYCPLISQIIGEFFYEFIC